MEASNRVRNQPAVRGAPRRPDCSRGSSRGQAAKQRGTRRAGDSRRGACVGTGEEKPLRLLPGKVRAMTESEETQLVDALSELLADWLENHPERLPASLESAGSRVGRGGQQL